jgi:hypothetical protein
VSTWFIFRAMKHVVLLLSLALCGEACTPGAFIQSSTLAPTIVGSWRLDGGGLRSTGFYDPETLEFAEAREPGQFITLTADGQFESGRVTRTGTGGCAVARYEYHRGTVVAHDSVLVLYATSGRVRSVAPCALNDDYEKNDAGIQTFVLGAGFVRASTY